MVLDRAGRVVFRETVHARLPRYEGPLCTVAELRRSGNLVVRRDAGLGDCLMILPALQAVKRAVRSLRITFEAPAEYIGLLRGFDVVDAAYAIGSERRASAHVLVDLSGYVERHPDAWRRDRIELFSEAIDAGWPVEMPHYRPCAADTEWGRRWLQKFLGQIPARIVGIALRGKYRHRSWPEDHVWELARVLEEAGVASIIFDSDPGAPRRWGYVPEPLCAYGLPLTKVGALVSLCQAVVSPDTGLLHLAGVLGIPSVGIFGAVDPRIRTKHYVKHVPVIAREIPCVPCCEGPLHLSCAVECMRAATPAMVAGVLEQLLTSPSAPPGEASL